MKRIVICCDGTWNAPDTEIDGLPVKTNVVKIANAVLPADERGTKQMMFYDKGVGTRGGRIRRMIDGATGRGLSDNLLNAYRYLIQNYEPGDQIFMFGFSRGAFTVRSLAGLIRSCGILRINAIDKVDHAFEIYSSRRFDTHPRQVEATMFRKTYSLSDIIPIKFMGVWDTVGALGNPLMLNGIFTERYSFHDHKLSSKVEYAYHAVAIDEKRRHFQAALWEKDPNDTHQTMEQVWFAGVHSNVGGGYTTTGLSDIALEWMAGKASAAGLALLPPVCKPNPMQPTADSRKSFYKLIPPHYRKIDRYCQISGKPAETSQGTSDGKLTCEALHPTVVQKYNDDTDYRPNNLVEFLNR
ncbi:MAG: DUF2235 domain-containing protein [Balneolaceae bacterium]|nr:MAG: DUF2235 domain-containing protein [Balneolaceae bacterium]